MLEQTRFPDAVHWARANFSGVNLGLPERNKRLVHSAACIAMQPGASFPTIFTKKDRHEALIRACQDWCIQFTQPDGTQCSAKLIEFARSLPGHSERHGTNHSKRRWPSSTKSCGSTGGSGDQDRSVEAVTQSGELREFVCVGCSHLGSQSASEHSRFGLGDSQHTSNRNR